MADNAPVQMKSTLGLTGLTMNAMALIAPGAFLWLTFQIQATTGVTSPSMWIGIVVALLLCLATAVCYAELAKLYPGPAAPTTSPSKPSSITKRPGATRVSRSSLWVGAHMFITGFIQV